MRSPLQTACLLVSQQPRTLASQARRWLGGHQLPFCPFVAFPGASWGANPPALNGCLRCPVQRGDRISPTTLDDRRQLVVAFEVPEAYLGRLRPGLAITATHPAYPDRPVCGRVSEIDSQVDAVLRTVRVRATLPNTDDRLRTGMSFRVRF